MPLPFGRPRVGISIPGAPAGARRAINCAYPSLIAFLRFCSDMMWLRRFCGDESKGFGRGADGEAGIGFDKGVEKDEFGDAEAVLLFAMFLC